MMWKPSVNAIWLRPAPTCEAASTRAWVMTFPRNGRGWSGDGCSPPWSSSESHHRATPSASCTARTPQLAAVEPGAPPPEQPEWDEEEQAQPLRRLGVVRPAPVGDAGDLARGVLGHSDRQAGLRRREQREE